MRDPVVYLAGLNGLTSAAEFPEGGTTMSTSAEGAFAGNRFAPIVDSVGGASAAVMYEGLHEADTTFEFSFELPDIEDAFDLGVVANVDSGVPVIGGSGPGAEGLPEPKVRVVVNIGERADPFTDEPIPRQTIDFAKPSGRVARKLPHENVENDDSVSQAQAELRFLGVPTVGSLSLGDPFLGGSNQSHAQAIARFVPVFADPGTPPDSIDVDVDLTVDGVLDVARDERETQDGERFTVEGEAFFRVDANLYTITEEGDPEIDEDNCTRCRSRGLFFGARNTDNSLQNPNDDIVEADINIDAVNSIFDAPHIEETIRHLVDIERSFEDVTFLSFDETFALELILSTNAKLTGLSDFLNTGGMNVTSDTPGITFVPVDINGNPIPEPVSTSLMATSIVVLMLVQTRSRRELAGRKGFWGR